MKIALVTGASKGLGLEWCRQLNLLGFKIILSARELNQARIAADFLGGESQGIYAKQLDVSNEAEIQSLAAQVSEDFGKIDLLINNAGINPKDYTNKEQFLKTFNLDHLDASEILRVIEINSLAPLIMVKHFRALLKASDQAVIINISSWLGSVTNLNFGGHYAYIGSKNLLNILNKSMAEEIKQDGIISVNVNPGWVQTAMGGKKATFTTEESVKNIISHVLIPIKSSDSGRFFNYDGTIHPY